VVEHVGVGDILQGEPSNPVDESTVSRFELAISLLVVGFQALPESLNRQVIEVEQYEESVPRSECGG
jgi:hypothetical protein